MSLPSRMALPVHPRGRGEHTGRAGGNGGGDGSSPRARGTLRPEPAEMRRGRFIPAGAGNTVGVDTGAGGATVHPRGRGEHPARRTRRLSQAGSSPRARGTPGARLWLQLRRRFIPAGAGNTVQVAALSVGMPVHPRGRGEHDSTRTGYQNSSGSSPRARGTHFALIELGRLRRFIPAGAGNTAQLASMGCDWAVHPRGRGEHAEVMERAGSGSGSSPRARGTHPGTADVLQHSRFIPAGAGNTR